MSGEGGAPRVRDNVRAIEAYAPGKRAAPGVTAHKLSSNETPLGPSPHAVAAYRAAIGELALYPEGSARVLREAIGLRYGLDPARIVCGNGSDDLLHLLAGAYVAPGDEGIFTEHGFTVYRIAILAAGGTPVVAPETDFCADVDAILARVTSRTTIVFLANPNNPTGTYLPFDELTRLRAGLPARVLLVLDAAYGEYVARNDYAMGVELVAAGDNVVMTRTFSKIHGLAAARIGWMFAPPAVCDAVNRIRGPFNVNGPAIAAGAAAIADVEHVEAAARHNAVWLPWVADKLAALGLTITPSVANFVLIHFPQTPGRTAAEAEAFLGSRGVIVRGVGAYGLPHALRMTIGAQAANEAAVAALSAFFDAAGDPHG